MSLRSAAFALLFALLLLPGALPGFAQTPAETPEPRAPIERLGDAPGKNRQAIRPAFAGRAALSSTQEAALQAFMAEAEWDDRFGLPGTDYWIFAATTAPSGDLYIGGNFWEANDVAAKGVARWDGHRFWPLGDGVDGDVRALLVVGDDLYVAGDFTTAGGAIVKGIARWDGTQWHALGSGLATDYGDGSAYALAYHDGKLYVGGSFTKAGGVAARGLAAWDGANWSGVSDGLTDYTYSAGTVYALTVADGDLYVGGIFDQAGTVMTNSVARLDLGDGTWHALGSGVGTTETTRGTVRTIAVDGGTVYVGGQFSWAGGQQAKNVARYDLATETWATLGSGVTTQYDNAELLTLTLYEGALYAAGRFTHAGGQTANHIARWDGTSWTPVMADGTNGLPDSGMGIHAVVPAQSGGLYVAGDFSDAAGVAANNIAHWEDGRWTVLGEGINSGTCCGRVHAIEAAPNGDVYVGGQFENAGSVAAQNIARWDGTRWHLLGGGVDGVVYAIAVNGDDVYVGGSFGTAGGVTAPNIARWNAATGTWHPLGTGISGSVYALAHDGQQLYVGGSFSTAGGVQLQNLAVWNGTNWTAFGQGVTFLVSSPIHALELYGGILVVGGSFREMKPAKIDAWVEVNSIALWDPAADDWYRLSGGVLDGGTYGTVNALAVDGDVLYVGGDFDAAGTVGANNIARFHPNTGWGTLGVGIGGSYPDVRAIAARQGIVYAGGSFSTAGLGNAAGIARWDGTAWSALGAGLTIDGFEAVHAVALTGTDLYVGGSFTSAEPPAHNFARWGTADGNGPTGEPRIAVDPPTVNFGNVTVGTGEVLMITVSNAADATANLTATVGAPAAPFSIDEGGGTFTLAPGESREVIVRFAPQTKGGAQGTVTITHNASNVASPVTVSLVGTGVGAATATVLRHFDPAGPQVVYTTRDGGFVFGTNEFGDRAKGVTFTPPAGKTGSTFVLTKVDIWFGYRSDAATGQSYQLDIYAGDAASGPTGVPLFTASYPISEIQADADPSTASGPTTHTLPTPLPLTGPFFVVVDFGTYSEPKLATIAAGTAIEQRVPEVWEAWQDGSWHNLSDAWFSETQQPGSGTRGYQPWIEVSGETQTGTGTEPVLPTELALAPNFPNPFNPVTTIGYAVDVPGPVRLQIFDAQGRLVRTLVDGVQTAGAYEVSFQAGDLPSGTYFYRLEAGSRQLTRAMMLLK